MRMLRGALIGSAVLALQQCAPAQAEALTWGVTAEGRLGYGTNPFLQAGRNAGTGLGGFTIAPMISLRGPTDQTTLSGSYNRDQYFSRYGNTDDFNIDLRRQQQLTSKLSATAHAGYFSSISGLLSPYYNSIVVDPGVVDQLAVGLRQRRLSGDVGLDWQPTERDRYSLSGVAEHDSFSSFGQTFNYYSLTGGYTRQIDARTHVGVQASVGDYTSHSSVSSKSLSPNLVVQRVLSARWSANASVGAIVERERFHGRTSTSVSPGFNVGVCGTYPKMDICFSASRQTASSGLGGLRRQTQLGANLTWRLTEHSRILAVGSYGFSNANDPVIDERLISGSLRYALARLDYQRDLSRRLTAGVSASYQERTGAHLPEAHALAVTANLTAHFGHSS